MRRPGTGGPGEPAATRPARAAASAGRRSAGQGALAAVVRRGTVGTHTRLVARRVTSSALIGRDAELAALHDAVSSARSGRARIVLLAGDAGIGKTRLITQVCARARHEGLGTAVGGCIQLGESSIAFAPLVEALRDLRRQLGAEVISELLGPAAAEIGVLFGEGEPSASGSGRGALFEHLLGFLVRLGARQPTLLVFEDMHWADASTRDLVAFLGRNLREAAVAVVLSYRTDELHRRHPLRGLLSDLERDPQVDRIPVGGLRRPELVALLTEISDTPATSRVVDDLLLRTEGNPLYVEELVAASLGGNLPATLSEAILARVSELPAPTPMVLHQAAVLGQSVDDELLAEVTSQSPGQIADALRAAVERQLLVVDESGCRFRHALIREALYDDLLPGERERLHIAAAGALQAPGQRARIEDHVRWTLLAYHADAAHDLPLAFHASVRAGIESERKHALADAAARYERAMQLWDQVPEPAAAAGMTRAELIMRAAKATQYSSHSLRDVALVEHALAALQADASPEQRALFFERLGRINWIHHRGPQAVAAYEQAVALLADRPPSWEQAFTLATLGQSLMLRDHMRQAETVLRRAIAVSQLVGAGATEGHALCSLGPTLVTLGRVTEGLDAMRRAHDLSRAHGTTDDVCRYYNNLVHNLNMSGQYEEAQRVAVEGIAYAASTGHLHHYGEALTGNHIMALVLSGRWQQAAEVKAAFELQVPGPDAYLETFWVNLLLGQGRYEQAEEVVSRLLDATAGADDVQLGAAVLLHAGELAALQGQWDTARQLLADGLRIAAATEDQYYASRGYAVALQAEADRVEATGPRNDAIAGIHETADRLIEQARHVAEAAEAMLPETQAWLATAQAHHLRVRGRDDAQDWDAVAENWDRIGQPYRAAYARYRQADAVLRHRGDRGQAAVAARAALTVADRLEAQPLATDIRQLAQRARLDLAPVSSEIPPQRASELNVTPREAEVLGQLAIGRTNRQIAETLFISEKTASVHVTNLLRKLGVTNRVEAARIAQRAGLTDN
jgi:ATP/maltotriose-dependent transcriptional regulator MalT